MMRPIGLRLAVLGLLAAMTAPSAGLGPVAVRTALAQEVTADPTASSLKVGDLRPGFVLNPDPAKTGSREPIPGILVYEADFTRERTPQNLRGGPVEIKSLVARTPNAQQATEQLTVSRQALTSASPPWVEGPVPKLGDESAGLTLKGSSGDGPAVAHLFLFRRGAMVVGITVAGLERPTKMAEAEALAAVVLGRIDPATTAQRATPVARPLNPQPPSQVTPAQAVTRSVRVANTEGSRLNVRASASTEAAIVARVTEGTVLELIGEDRQAGGRTWRNVRAPDGVTGWAAGDYVVAVDPPAGAAAATAPSTTAPSAAARTSSGTTARTPTPGGTATSTPASSTPASSVPVAPDALLVEVVPRLPEIAADVPQFLDVKVTRNGAPIENAQVRIETTSNETPSAPPTDATGSTSAAWTPAGPSGDVGVGVIVTAPDGTIGAGSARFKRT